MENDRQPDNSYEEKNGGFLFTAWGIHVAADDLDDAKLRILEDHGKDVDEDLPPIPTESVEGT